MTSLGKSL